MASRFRRILYRSHLWKISKIPLGLLFPLLVLGALRHPDNAKNRIFDALMSIRTQREAGRVRLIEIDDKDYEDLFCSRSPLDPAQLGQLLDSVARAGPSAVVVDIDTSAPSFREARVTACKDPRVSADNKLLKVGVPVVWNSAYSSDNHGNDQSSFDESAFEILPPLGGSAAAKNFALAEARIDDNGYLRNYKRLYKGTLRVSQDSIRPLKYICSPAYAVAQILAGHGEADAPCIAEPLSEDQNRLLFERSYLLHPIRARDLLEDARQPGWDKIGYFKGKVVVIGGAYHAARDEYFTRKGELSGCEVIATEIQAELSGMSITERDRDHLLYVVVAGFAIYFLYRYLIEHWRRAYQRKHRKQPSNWKTIYNSRLYVFPLLAATVDLEINAILHGSWPQAAAFYPAVLLVLWVELYAATDILTSVREVLVAVDEMYIRFFLRKRVPAESTSVENPPAHTLHNSARKQSRPSKASGSNFRNRHEKKS